MSSTPLRPGAVAIPAVAAAVLYVNPLRARSNDHIELAADPSSPDRSADPFKGVRARHSGAKRISDIE